MKPLIKILKQQHENIKLAYSKGLTSIGLKIFTYDKKINNVAIIRDISYGKNKLQTYDITYPSSEDFNKCNVAFYVHGGSWCGGDKYGYTFLGRKLAKKNYVVININYRLIPKVGIRTCIADCIKAIRHFCLNGSSILKNNNFKSTFDLNKTFMLGDSAGAHLVSLIAAKQTACKLRLKLKIKALGLYYGAYDLNNIDKDPSPILNSLYKYFKISEENTTKLFKEISTTTFITPKFPPSFIASGQVDKLHFQSELLVRALEQNNVEFKYLNFEKSRLDGCHAFLNVPALKSFKEAFLILTEFFEKINKEEKNDKEK